MDESGIPTIALAGGVTIPQVGFGVWRIPPAQTQRVVEQALEVGYRHFDGAAMYGNEAEVAAAFRAAGIARQDVFYTSKVNNPDHGFDAAQTALDTTLAQTGFDYVDLYLIHWPQPSKDLFVETWRALIDLQSCGKARAIGVSNFRAADLSRLISDTGVVPAVNQVELHPWFQQRELVEVHQRLGIVTEAWRPLALGQALEDPQIVAVAQAHGVTSAQVVLRWHVQLGHVIFPKTVHVERMRENLDLFGFELTPTDMETIAALDRGTRMWDDPAVRTW